MRAKYNTIPFDPAKAPVFYGWIVIFAGTVGVLMSLPGQTIGVSAFVEHLIDALGLSRVELSTAYMIGTISSSLVLTPAGKLYDRLGSRFMSAGAAFLLGVVLLTLSRADVISQSTAATIPSLSADTTAFIVITCGFFLIRFLGQGVLTMVSRNMIVKWFDKKRGITNGISGVFVSLGFSIAPLVMDKLIGIYGWRGAWVVMAFTVGIVFAAFALVIFRDNPEDCGLLPDGEKHDKTNPKAQADHYRQYTLAEARKTFAFWVYAMALAMFGLYFTAMAFHIVSIFGTGGMDRDTAFSIFLPASVISVVIHLCSGWLSDHMNMKYLLSAFLVGLMLSMTGLVIINPGTPVWVMIVGNGLAGGLFALLSAVVWPRFFGREHLGAISGLSLSLIVFHSAIGPWLFSQSFDKWQSYRPAGILLLAITMILLLCSFFANNPQDDETKPA